MTPELPDRPDRSKSVAVLDFLRARLLSIFFLLVFFLALTAYLFAGWSPPRILWIVLLSILPGAFVGGLVGFYTRSKYDSTDWHWLVDLDAPDQREFAIYRMPQRHIADFSVTDGSLDVPAPNVYLGANVDLDARTVEGTWRGSLSDRQLLASLQAVRECRGQLEADAKVGFQLRHNLFSVVRRATISNVKRIVETFEKGTLADKGESIEVAVAESIDGFNVDESDSPLRDLDADLDDLDLDDLGKLVEVQTEENPADRQPSDDPLNFQGDSDD